MPVYRLDIAYDGTGFNGYASQPGLRTVQGELESALSTYLRSPVKTSVAGRTDAGVHAAGQVVSFSHNEDVELNKLKRGLRGIIGHEVSVMSVAEVDDTFDARFSARWRRYRYLMDTRWAPDPMTRHFVWHTGRALDMDKVLKTSRAFLGTHDFSAFCRNATGKSNVRNLSDLAIGDERGLLTFWVEANAFCHQMVRSIVGYLYDIGRGYSDPGEVHSVIDGKDRSVVGTVAPAKGLTLWEVGYD